MQLEKEIDIVVKWWKKTVSSANLQNDKLNTACHNTRQVLDLIQEINNFLDQLEQELPLQGVFYIILCNFIFAL